MPALSKAQLETKKKKREKRLEAARNRIDLNLGKGKRTAKTPVSKKKPVDRYRRTGGFGMSAGQKTKLALEKKKKRDAAIAKRKAQEAKRERVQQEEGPGRGTTPSFKEKLKARRADAEKRFEGPGYEKEPVKERMAKSTHEVVKTDPKSGKMTRRSPEETHKIRRAAARAKWARMNPTQRRTAKGFENFVKYGSYAIPAGAGVRLAATVAKAAVPAVKAGAAKVTSEIAKARLKAKAKAEAAKKLRQKEALKEAKKAEDQRKKLEAANKNKKTKGPQVSTQTKGGRGKVTEKPGERQTWLQKLKAQREARAKTKADAKKKAEAQAKKDAKKKDNGRSSTEKTTDAATKHRESLAAAATKGRGKGTGTSTTTKPKPAVSLKDRILARPINTKTGKPYGPRSTQYKNWRNKVDKYKARGKGAAKLGAAGLGGYGLSELLRDRASEPGQKPTQKTTRTTTAPKKKVLGGRGKVTEKPGARAAAAAASDAARRTYPPKTKINGMMAPKKPKEESGTVMSGRPEDRKSRDVAADKRHFAISRGGTQDDPNRGFRRRLLGKNVSEAEAKKGMEEAYKREQEDRKRGGQSDHYQYGTGRRSQLKGKQGVKKGGVVGKSKGGMVRFSTGGRVLDTYDYN